MQHVVKKQLSAFNQLGCETPTTAFSFGCDHQSSRLTSSVRAAIEEGVPVDVLSASLYVRFRSRQDHTFAEKVLSAMRQKFGGHVERPTGG